MTDTERASGLSRRSKGRFALLAILVLLLASLTLFLGQNAAAVSITVPYATSVADADLDGNPATGTWADALSATIPLENGAASPYGSATLYAKHDGAFAYFRIDGSIDVPWVSAGGNRFWLGMQVSPTGTSHHGGATWDGTFFGLWDGSAYSPQPVYPPSAVDTNGFLKPPSKDAVQDAVGKMRYSGSAAPYGFTAEWKKMLNPGDANDLVLAADGATTYNFFVTTDSDGGGSNGGSIGHKGVTNSNTMRFAVPSGPNTPPQADLTSPNGGEVWSGGSSHRIWWNMSDPETATASLRVWVNYSSDGGTTYGPISGAQGLSGLSNPCSFAWTVPASTTSQAQVKVTVLDAQSSSAADSSLANFAVDATAPTVTALSPLDGATGVSVSTQARVSFSESMDAASAEQAFSLTRVDTGSPVAGTMAWSGNDLVFTPSSALAGGVVYRIQVAATAKDASNPGNPLGGASTSTFTTADTTPPTISSVSAAPSPQQAGGRVNVSAAVSDNGVVAEVWIEIRDPGSALVGNFSATFDAGTGRSFHDAAYAQPGTHGYRISAKDAAGNWNVATGTFAVVDTVPPTIQHVPVTQAVKDAPILISATITDVDAVADARVDYTDVLGSRSNVSMTLNGGLYEFSIPGQTQLGALTYFLWARDPTGNAERTPTYTVTVVGSDTVPPSIFNLAAVPAVQNATGIVNISASVTDNVAVQSVDVVVTDPPGQPVGNVSMSRLGATDTHYDERAYYALGTYTFTVWAVDGSSNAASASGSFRIVDLVAPVFQAVSAIPAAAEAGQVINISASVTDNVAVSEVRIALRGPTGGLLLDQALTASSGLYWINVVPTVLGNLTFLLTATDGAGNVATYSGNVSVTDTQPPVAVAGPDVTVWAGSTVTFNGSGSHDNFAIANFTWSFAYNGTPVLLYGVAAAFTFTTTGRFNVSLTVVDAAGLLGTSVMNVTVISDTTPPPAPGKLAVLSIAPACLRVTWEASAASDLVGYRVFRWNRTRASFDLIANLSADATTYTDCGLEDDTVYSYWVIAYDSTGNLSPPSPIDNGRTSVPVSTVSNLDPLYQSVVAILAVLVLILAVLWFEARGRKRPPGPKLP